MGRKKTSTKNPSTPTNDHADQADHVSISTYSSDTASVPLDRTPPSAFSTVLLPSTDDPAGFQQQVCKCLESILANSVALHDRLNKIESRLSTLEPSPLLESKLHIPFVQDPDLPFINSFCNLLTYPTFGHFWLFGISC